MPSTLSGLTCGAASTLFSEPLGPSKCVPMPLLCPKGREAERSPWTVPLAEEQGPRSPGDPPPPPPTPDKALENPFSVPTPLPRRKVGSGLYCPSGTGVSVCGEEMTTRGAQGKSDVRLPRGQERTATICSPALASLSALGERRLRPTLSALLPPPGHSRPSLGGRGQERPLSPGDGLSTREGGRLAASLRSPHLCPWELRLSDPRAPRRQRGGAGKGGLTRRTPCPRLFAVVPTSAAGREPEALYPRVESGGSHLGA